MTHGIFSEVTPDVFAHTRLSTALDSGVDPEVIVHRTKLTNEAHEASRIRSFGYSDAQLSTYLNFDTETTYDNHEHRSRWKNKYCAPTSGAALSALVGILCVVLMKLPRSQLTRIYHTTELMSRC